MLKGVLAAAVRAQLIVRNPAVFADPPPPGDGEAGRVLDEHQLAQLSQWLQGDGHL